MKNSKVDKIKKCFSSDVSVLYCDEFVCKCMQDKSFKCPGLDKYGAVSPNGTYRRCLHYYCNN